MAILQMCHKCENGTISAGPRYFYKGYDGDWLVYSCTCCGYQEHMRPKDYKEPEIDVSYTPKPIEDAPIGALPQ